MAPSAGFSHHHHPPLAPAVGTHGSPAHVCDLPGPRIGKYAVSAELLALWQACGGAHLAMKSSPLAQLFKHRTLTVGQYTQYLVDRAYIFSHLEMLLEQVHREEEEASRAQQGDGTHIPVATRLLSELRRAQAAESSMPSSSCTPPHVTQEEGRQSDAYQCNSCDSAGLLNVPNADSTAQSSGSVATVIQLHCPSNKPEATLSCPHDAELHPTPDSHPYYPRPGNTLYTTGAPGRCCVLAKQAALCVNCQLAFVKST